MPEQADAPGSDPIATTTVVVTAENDRRATPDNERNRTFSTSTRQGRQSVDREVSAGQNEEPSERPPDDSIRGDENREIVAAPTTIGDVDESVVVVVDQTSRDGRNAAADDDDCPDELDNTCHGVDTDRTRSTTTSSSGGGGHGRGRDDDGDDGGDDVSDLGTNGSVGGDGIPFVHGEVAIGVPGEWQAATTSSSSLVKAAFLILSAVAVAVVVATVVVWRSADARRASNRANIGDKRASAAPTPVEAAVVDVTSSSTPAPSVAWTSRVPTKLRRTGRPTPALTTSASPTRHPSPAPTDAPSVSSRPSSSAAPTYPVVEWTTLGNETGILGEREYNFLGADVAFTDHDNSVWISSLVGDVRLYELTREELDDGSPIWIPSPSGRLPFHGDGKEVVDNEFEIYSEARLAATPDGNHLAIGNPNAKHRVGQVAVFSRDADGAWYRRGSVLRGVHSGDNFGGSVALTDDGQRLVVGASTWSSGAGHVDVLDYHRATSDEKLDVFEDWCPVLLLRSDADDVVFGYTVALATATGDRFVVGARDKVDNLRSSGSIVFVDVADLADGVVRRQRHTSDVLDDHFGVSTSMSADGTRALAGSSFFKTHVLVFELSFANDEDEDGRGAWRRTWTVLYPDYTMSTHVSLSADGDRLTVGRAINSVAVRVRTYCGLGGYDDHVATRGDVAAPPPRVCGDILGEEEHELSAFARLSRNGTRIAIGSTRYDGTYRLGGRVVVYESSE